MFNQRIKSSLIIVPHCLLDCRKLQNKVFEKIGLPLAHKELLKALLYLQSIET